MPKRYRIPLTDRTIAGALLLRLANHPQEHHDQFCLDYTYDYDCEFLAALARDLGVPNAPSKPYIRRLQRICRHLQACGILHGRLSSCHKEYIGEPAVLKSYEFGEPGYAARLAPERHPYYKPMGKVQTELDFLLDRCYPEEPNGRNDGRGS